MVRHCGVLVLTAHNWFFFTYSLSMALYSFSLSSSSLAILFKVNIGHPDSGCAHGLGPGCAAAAGNMTSMWLKIGGIGIDTAFGYHNQVYAFASSSFSCFLFSRRWYNRAVCVAACPP